MTAENIPTFDHPPVPTDRIMNLVDEYRTPAPPRAVFDVVRDVANWPRHLGHYRYVRYRSRSSDGGGIVEMAANRPFGPLNWPTWWLSEMSVNEARPAVRFRHVGGITTNMDVEWLFDATTDGGTHVRLVHVWNGPPWPLISRFAAVKVIGPVFVHAIATRTMAGLARAAERSTTGEVA